MSTQTILFRHIFENSCGDDKEFLFSVFLKDGFVDDENYLSLTDVISLFEEYVKPVDGHIQKEDIVKFFSEYSCSVAFMEYTEITKYNFGEQ